MRSSASGSESCGIRYNPRSVGRVKRSVTRRLFAGAHDWRVALRCTRPTTAPSAVKTGYGDRLRHLRQLAADPLIDLALLALDHQPSVHQPVDRYPRLDRHAQS